MISTQWKMATGALAFVTLSAGTYAMVLNNEVKKMKFIIETHEADKLELAQGLNLNYVPGKRLDLSNITTNELMKFSHNAFAHLVLGERLYDNAVTSANPMTRKMGLEEAIAHYQSSMELRESCQAPLYKGMALARDEQFFVAEQELEKAVTLCGVDFVGGNPYLEIAGNWLAYTNLRQGEPENVEKYARLALLNERDPDVFYNHSYLGWSLMKLGRYEEAELELRETEKGLTKFSAVSDHSEWIAARHQIMLYVGYSGLGDENAMLRVDELVSKYIQNGTLTENEINAIR